MTKDTINMISENSGVRLGLGLLILGGFLGVMREVVLAPGKIKDEFRAELAANYVTRDLFTVQMEALRHENELRFATLSAQISDLKVSVAAKQ